MGGVAWAWLAATNLRAQWRASPSTSIPQGLAARAGASNAQRIRRFVNSRTGWRRALAAASERMNETHRPEIAVLLVRPLQVQQASQVELELGELRRGEVLEEADWVQMEVEGAERGAGEVAGEEVDGLRAPFAHADLRAHPRLREVELLLLLLELRGVDEGALALHELLSRGQRGERMRPAGEDGWSERSSLRRARRWREATADVPTWHGDCWRAKQGNSKSGGGASLFVTAQRARLLSQHLLPLSLALLAALLDLLNLFLRKGRDGYGAG